MKNLGTVLAAVFLAVVLILYMCTFEVRFTEVAIKKTWGKPAREAITEPGLNFKLPPPIQTVVVYDKRIRILEDRTEETRTVDGKNLVATTYTLWRITDPARFHTNFPAGEEEGEKKLRTTVQAHKHAVIGKRKLEEFISTEGEVRKIGEIEEEITRAIARDASNQYGVEVVDFGIKKLGLPEAVTTAIFESMKSNEEKKASQYTAQAEAQAAAILAQARAAESRILAAADKKVQAIRTEAEGVVSEYYKKFHEHPELRIFLDTLNTVAEALRYRTTLVTSTKTPPWDVLDETAPERFAPGKLRTDATELSGIPEPQPANLAGPE
jgi:membrane protease subunit HflC